MVMKKATDKKPTQRGVSDLVGLDFATTATKVVRLKKARGGFTLTGIDMLPPVDFSQAAHRVELPRNLTSYYCCLAYSGLDAVVRIVNAPLPAESHSLTDNKLRELLNISEDYRVASYLTKHGKGRQDSSFLVAAIPNDDARFLLNMFPVGPPAPASIEVAGLSFMGAFFNARGEACAERAVCLIEAGEEVSYFVFVNKGQVTLAGKFNFGGKQLRSKVVAELGVDDELAATILKDQSINITSTIEDVMKPFLKQLSISKDFVERHQGCRIFNVYVSGGVSLLPHWTSVVSDGLKANVVTWSPLENIQYDPEMIPDELRGQEARFAAAIGAVIGGLQEK